MRVIKTALMATAIVLSAFGGITSVAQASPPQTAALSNVEQTKAALMGKTFRGGLDLQDVGCKLGAEGCQGGWVMQFGEKNGRFGLGNKWGAGSAAYQGLKDGNKWSGESKMGNWGLKEVSFSPDGTFGFAFGPSRHKNCRLIGTDHLQCDWENDSGFHKVVNLWQR